MPVLAMEWGQSVLSTKSTRKTVWDTAGNEALICLYVTRLFIFSELKVGDL